MRRISSAEFIRNYGSISDEAVLSPVFITRNGRDRFVFMSAEMYRRLAQRALPIAAGLDKVEDSAVDRMVEEFRVALAEGDDEQAPKRQVP